MYSNWEQILLDTSTEPEYDPKYVQSIVKRQTGTSLNTRAGLVHNIMKNRYPHLTAAKYGADARKKRRQKLFLKSRHTL